MIAFEPNPDNFSRLQKNIEINRLNNIRIVNAGIGKKQEIKTLTASALDSARGSMNEDISAQILKRRNTKNIPVKIDSLDNYVKNHGLTGPDFIKIDIEGLEYEALLGMSDTINSHKPQFFIEIHGVDRKSKVGNIKKIVSFLESHGYMIYHVESEQDITESNAETACEGHIFAE